MVVCQHGRRGVPRDVIEGDNSAYHNFAARLADQGFITFAPHNLYRGEDRYRWLCRKANGVKASYFPSLSASTIRFYVGCKLYRWWIPNASRSTVSAMGGRLLFACHQFWKIIVYLYVPAISIAGPVKWRPRMNGSALCTVSSGKCLTSMKGSIFDYAEMTYLMIPRPFMVERGHWDQVGRDQWVAYEYEKLHGSMLSSSWPMLLKLNTPMEATPFRDKAHSSFYMNI